MNDGKDEDEEMELYLVQSMEQKEKEEINQIGHLPLEFQYHPMSRGSHLFFSKRV